jgi:O-antigen/teichoic acid export membrane protein
MKSILGIVLDHSDTGETSPALTPRADASVFAGTSTQMVRSGVFSLFDQGVVSGTNFFTTLILARTCSQDELGVYSLAWTIVLFLAAIQGNLITVPYTMYCHRRSGQALAQYAGSTLAHQLLTSLAAMACFFGLDVLLSLGCGPERLRAASWVLLGVIPFLLLREYARRFAFAHLALATAITIDVVAAVLQLGTLLVLRQFGLLSAAAVYAAMGMACAVASLCWWFLDSQPMRFSRVRFLVDWRRNWSFGKWAMLSQLTGLAFYALPWMLASVHGEAATGELHACSNLVGLSNLFVLGLNNLLMPKAARAFSRQGAHSLFRVLRQTAACSFVVLGGMCVVVYFAGNTVAGIVFGAEYADTGPLLTVLALATLADAMGLTASTGLWAMDRPGMGIIGDVAQLIVTLGVALWLVFPMGAMGIAIALVAGRTTGASVRWLTFWRLIGVAHLEPTTA